MQNDMEVLAGEDWEMHVADNDTPMSEEDFAEEF